MASYRDPDPFNRPLGEAQRTSNRTESEFSSASAMAADNLLTKAERRLQAGEDEQAAAFVQRALRLPFDKYEEVQPAPWSAHMALFMAISDDLEDSDEGDQRWLDRAETLLSSSGPAAESEIRSVLRSLVSDAYSLSPTETRRLKALTAGIPLNADPLAGTPDDEQSRTEAIIEVLRALLEHRSMKALTP